MPNGGVSRLGLIALAFSMLACGSDASVSPLSIDLLTEDQPSPLCMDALGMGQLVADPRSGLGIAASADLRYSVMWPYGYSAVYVDDVIWLLDPTGRRIAAEGDNITMGGGTIRGLWYACTGSIKRAV